MFAIFSHFLPSRTFASKLEPVFLVGDTLCGATRVGYSLAHKQMTRVEVTDIDKHSILLRYGFNYDRKKFYSANNVLIR